MKGVIVREYGDSSKMEVEELPDPKPSNRQVLIKTKFASVNFADIMAVAGNYAVGTPPFTPGIDAYGTVVEVGDGVDRSWIGKDVIAFVDNGGYSQYCLATLGQFFEVKDGVDELQAAASPLLLGTAYGLLHSATDLRDDDSILVHAGAGGVGTTLISMAIADGSSKVVALVSRQEKLKVVEERGAIGLLYGESSQYAERIKDALGAGIDLSLNSIGGDTLGEDLKVTNAFGRVLVFGMASGRPGSVASNLLHPTSRAVIGYSFGNLRRNRPADVAPLMENALVYLNEGKVSLEIGAVIKIDDVRKAHDLITSRQSVGKVLLSFD
ncbi:MAG: zinc-binding dehydrogenase [Actinomycetota bacterium]|nr:zinc-binding dehydrogenase [Actinomycetota bacterium]